MSSRIDSTTFSRGAVLGELRFYLQPVHSQNIMNQLRSQLAANQADRIAKMKPQDNSTVVCEVTGWDINVGAFTGKAPDGSLRYFRFIGNASLPIGSQVSVVLPMGASVGWADTKAR
ncbi:MAG: hypothetical protein IM566_04270 [Pseudanabaena sp. M152S2SP2A07QC]|nr:hypothetical protein [Pseudanabaena sp. M109S1SP2A07QC]MCA6546639.1 hypothetical protein [Pseudanabaena sp. M152S2SP2A07QC]